MAASIFFMLANPLSIQISVQGFLSLLLAMYGILYIAGDFKEIRANVQLQNK